MDNKIKSLMNQNDLVKFQNDEILEDIRLCEENKEEIQKEADEEIETLKKKINWDKEKNKLSQSKLADRLKLSPTKMSNILSKN